MKCYLLNVLELQDKMGQEGELWRLMPVSRQPALRNTQYKMSYLSHLGAGLLMSYAALRGETEGKPERLSGKELPGCIRSMLQGTKGREGKDLPDIRIGKKGKPYYCTPYKALYFNASHSGDFVFLVLSDKEIGCDMQILEEKNRKDAIAKRFMTEGEFSRYGQTRGMDREDCFYEAWCEREALGKYTGDGVAGLLEAELNPILEREGLVMYKSRQYLEDTWYYFAVCEKG